MASRPDVLVLACALVMMSCGEATPSADDTDATLDTDPAEDSDTGDPCRLWTWETAGAPVILTWCTPCHSSRLTGPARSGAPAGVDLDDEADTRALADRVLARATGDMPTMPPTSGPDEDALAALTAWLTCVSP